MYKKETKVDEPINKGEVKRGTTPIHLSNWGSIDSEFTVIVTLQSTASLTL